jgi:acetylornithine/succinyldiaminopimelate/putrescine aminotransferase
MLRHACGYALVNAGHDTRRIQDWLGHRSDRQITTNERRSTNPPMALAETLRIAISYRVQGAANQCEHNRQLAESIGQGG